MTTIITNAVLTAYCSCRLCCGPHATGLAANGKPPVQGITIAASRRIPLGSTVLINGHAFLVQDRLARRYDNRFDIYFNSHDAARKFGIWTNKVTIVTKE